MHGAAAAVLRGTQSACSARLRAFGVWQRAPTGVGVRAESIPNLQVLMLTNNRLKNLQVGPPVSADFAVPLQDFMKVLPADKQADEGRAAQGP